MVLRRRRVNAGEQESLPTADAEKAVEKPVPVESRSDVPTSNVRSGPWGEVIRHVYQLEIRPTYDKLNAELSLGDGATEYGQVLKALDESARNAFLAARLVRAAKLEDECCAAEASEREEVMRSHARAQLDAEKAAAKEKGGVAKAPTLQEIEGRMVTEWPDELYKIRRERSEMHGALRAIEALEKAWWERCNALRKMSERFVAGRG